MSNLQIFQSPEWGSIRTVELDGEPWLVDQAPCIYGFMNPAFLSSRSVSSRSS